MRADVGLVLTSVCTESNHNLTPWLQQDKFTHAVSLCRTSSCQNKDSLSISWSDSFSIAFRDGGKTRRLSYCAHKFKAKQICLSCYGFTLFCRLLCNIENSLAAMQVQYLSLFFELQFSNQRHIYHGHRESY